MQNSKQACLSQVRKKSFKVGDKVVRCGQVYKIFKIKEKKRIKNEENKIIFFRPYFRKRGNTTLIYSIPVTDIDKTDIRRPIPKKKLRQLLKSLSQKTERKIPVDIIKARVILSLNDPYENVKILKCLWKEKNDESTKFSKSKEDVFELAIENLIEETALIDGISPDDARKKIEAALEGFLEN